MNESVTTVFIEHLWLMKNVCIWIFISCQEGSNIKNIQAKKNQRIGIKKTIMYQCPIPQTRPSQPVFSARPGLGYGTLTLYNSQYFSLILLVK